MPKVVGKLTDGPRRVLVQEDHKPTRTVTASVAPDQRPNQRVLIRTASAATNPMKKPLGPSSSINPPAPASLLPVVDAKYSNILSPLDLLQVLSVLTLECPVSFLVEDI